MLSRTGVEVEGARLEGYYSNPVYVDMFGGKVYFHLIPRRNSTLNGSQKWKETVREFVRNTMRYLEEYHRRSSSEAGFAADRKMLGWNVAQRRGRTGSRGHCSAQARGTICSTSIGEHAGIASHTLTNWPTTPPTRPRTRA